jgi:hypothetical protein
VTEQDLLDFTLALRTRLKEEPNDYRGWLLLGRLTLDGNDPEMAREALERAYALAPQKAMVAVPYAQADDDGGGSPCGSAVAGGHCRGSGQHRGPLRPRLHGPAKRGFPDRPRPLAGMLPLLEPGSARYTMVERSWSTPSSLASVASP